jgi:hypothetical protein
MGASLATASTQRCPPDTAHALSFLREITSLGCSNCRSPKHRHSSTQTANTRPCTTAMFRLLCSEKTTDRLKNPIGMMISIPEESTHLTTSFSVVSPIISLFGVQESVILLVCISKGTLNPLCGFFISNSNHAETKLSTPFFIGSTTW